MRLPIVQFPNIVVNNLSHFASVFATEEQKKHFCEYVTGLMVTRPPLPLLTLCSLTKTTRVP